MALALSVASMDICVTLSLPHRQQPEGSLDPEAAEVIGHFCSLLADRHQGSCR